uniref:Uncharacterized protein n=1 Tax=Rhizophora mucronata TaxID=61149 RepID=A0A2P2PQJ4_RHIMU
MLRQRPGPNPTVKRIAPVPQHKGYYSLIPRIFTTIEHIQALSSKRSKYNPTLRQIAARCYTQLIYSAPQRCHTNDNEQFNNNNLEAELYEELKMEK